MNDFLWPLLNVEIFLALVAPGNCCHAYISIDMLGGAEWGVFLGGEVVWSERRKVIGETGPGETIDFRTVENNRLFSTIEDEAMKTSLLLSSSASIGRSNAGCLANEYK